jgi:hypothetical protein
MERTPAARHRARPTVMAIHKSTTLIDVGLAPKSGAEADIS